MQERLQKIIARAGIASRRHAEQLILSGQVRVNGQVVRGLGTQAGGRSGVVVEPDAEWVHAANFWNVATLRGSKRNELRKVMFAAQQPVEKLKRSALGPLTLEGLPQGRYRLLEEKEVEALR